MMDEELQENEIFALIVKQIDRRAARPAGKSDLKVPGYARYSMSGQEETSVERQSEGISRYAETIGIAVYEGFDNRGVSTDE